MTDGRIENAGDGLTIEELIDLHGDRLLRLCLLYMGDHTLAEDAFQETMLKAWRGLPGFKGASAITTWLSHIAVNTCRDMLRTGWFRARKNSRPMDEALHLAAPAVPETGDVTAAVMALPLKYREVAVLYYYENMQLNDIAQCLGLSVNTVSTRLRRGRNMLEARLREGGYGA